MTLGSFLRKLFGGGAGLEPAAAKRFLAENPDAIVIDVRQAGEFRSGHLAKARHVPVGLVGQKAKHLDKDAKFLVYCHLGPRASRAASILAREGFKNVYKIQGGIVAWQRWGFPVEKK